MQEIISKKNIGARLKELRDGRNLSQAEVSAELGLSRSHYSQVELGKQFPSYQVLSRVAEFYGRNYEWILHGKEMPEGLSAAAGVQENASVQEAGQQIALVNSEDLLMYLKNREDQGFISRLPRLSLPLSQLGQQVYRAFQVEGDHPALSLFDQDVVVGELVTDTLRVVISRTYIMVLRNKIIVRKIYEYQESGVWSCLSDESAAREDIRPEDIVELWEVKLKISFKLNKSMNARVNPEMEQSVSALAAELNRLKAQQAR